jgi:hypothetical protein
MDTIEFTPYPKTPRLRRDCIITEKIDGTNAGIIVTKDGQVAAQSRKRLITPDDDNFGFAAHVDQHKELYKRLGTGVHFGEWFGHGIQSGYGYENGRRELALFNVNRFNSNFCMNALNGVSGHVPILAEGIFTDELVQSCLNDLKNNGSRITEGFPAEGIIVYLKATNQVFKVLIENDEVSKTQATKHVVRKQISLT